jgi:hypothetical protein
MELQFHPGPAARIYEISASSWFYYKEICYDARSQERKIQRSGFFYFSHSFHS